MGDTKVYVIDRVVTKPGRAREFVESYLAEYTPGAARRGMALAHILVSPPIWLDDESNTVTITWELDGPRAWWEMTSQSRPDTSLGQWWEKVGQLLVHRSRSMASAAADVDRLCRV